jgi:3-hydroxyisobutyrate dehydrogenase
LPGLGPHRGYGTGRWAGRKLINQHLCSVHLAAAGEALALADRLGLDPATTLELISGGAAGSWMLSDRGPRMLADTDVEVASAVSIFVKDSGLVDDAARTVGAHTPLLEAARDAFREAADRGLAQRDDSRVVEVFATP